MTIEKNIWADIQDGVTQGLAAAELVNGNKRAVNELVDVVNGLGTASTMTNASGGSTLGTASTKNVATNAEALAGTAGVLLDAAGGHSAFKQYGYGGTNPVNIALNCDDLPAGARNSWTDPMSESTAVSLNLPAIGGYPHDPRSWHVECFGLGINRLVQEATEVFGINTIKGRKFIRIKHDTWWPWVEVMTAANLTSANFDSNLGRLVKVGDFGLGRFDNAPFIGVELNPDDYRVGGAYVGNFNVYGGGRSGFLAVHAGSSADVCAQEFIDWDIDNKYFRVRKGGVWQQWRELYHTGNTVGTVSQSGGVPTGAIIQRGSNANGEFVRFADGTQICHRRISFTTNAPSPLGRVSPPVTWVFPAGFFNSETAEGSYGIFGNSTNSPDSYFLTTNGACSTTQCSLVAYSVTESDRQRTLNVYAVGRWY